MTVKSGLDQYDAVYVPGGHAPMVDLMQDKDFGKVLRHFHEKGKVTAFLCHGPIASLAALDDAEGYRESLVSGDFDAQAKLSKGWQYAGYRMTIYSDPEEYPVEKFVLKGQVPFYVADALQIAGGTVEHAPVGQGHVVVDRELITGQNPASDHMVGDALVKALSERK
ncbi:MAG: type 1 glutamine amidotransferase domain-containing protein [Aeromonadales bacterium]|nr:type 1 glutamine amidotransferase domain-containing protein [Aeromonadales bacterium]MDY2890919.1 type 1 glutamine amidotransferase domain-containing protein [Succinivibrio sp.]